MNSMMLMREDGQMGTCRICGKNFGLIGGYMEEFTGERLNVCVDCIKKFRQISEEDSSRVRTIVDDLISSCNNEKTLPILKKYKAKAVADSQMKEQIAIMKKREVEKTPDIIVTTCDLKEDYSQKIIDCPHCGKAISATSEKCPYCQKEINQQPEQSQEDNKTQKLNIKKICMEKELKIHIL